MPVGAQGGDEVVRDRALAAAALGREHAEVIVAAVGATVLLVETVLAELSPALRAYKMIRMPRLVQRRHATLNIFSYFYCATLGARLIKGASKNISYESHSNI